MAREARGWKKQRWRRAGIRVGSDVASRSQQLKFGEGTLQGENEMGVAKRTAQRGQRS